MEHLANTTSVQNLDPKTVGKFMNNSDTGKSLKLQHNKIASIILWKFCATCFLVDFST